MRPNTAARQIGLKGMVRSPAAPNQVKGLKAASPERTQVTPQFFRFKPFTPLDTGFGSDHSRRGRGVRLGFGPLVMPIGAVARREGLGTCGGSEARTRWTEIGFSPPMAGPTTVRRALEVGSSPGRLDVPRT